MLQLGRCECDKSGGVNMTTQRCECDNSGGVNVTTREV